MDDRWITDWEPSARFPHYTRANAGEVLPDPSSPLNLTFPWELGLLKGWRDGYVELLGTHRASELSEDRPEAVGSFGGYHYINLSATRMIGRRMPGSTVEAFDRAVFGDHPDVPPYVEHPDDDCPECTARLGERIAFALSTEEFPEVEEGKRRADAARAGRPDLAALTDAELVDRARSLLGDLRYCYAYHVPTTTLSTVAPAVLAPLLEQLGEPSALGVLMSGLGGVDSAAPSFALWDLSRAVRSSPALTEAFDAGVADVLERLATAADDADAARFVERFADFSARYGSRAPNEWDIRSDSWETKPALALLAVDRMRQMGDEADPGATLERSRAEREALTARLADALPDGEARATFLAAAASIARFNPWRERTKTSCVKVMHEMRMAFFELGRRMVERGVLDDHRNITMLTTDELDGFVADPGAHADEIRRRAEQYRELFELDPPFILTRVPPLGDWPRRVHRRLDPAAPGDVLTGLPGSPGVARGRARIVTDPLELGGFEPGDVLVAPQTDPAWTPLFVPSAAVVVNVGAAITHAVIVSREVGIPCAISVADATLRIPDGALVEVDGDTGTVRLL